MIKDTIKRPLVITPVSASLPDGRDVVIDVMTNDQTTEMFLMIQEAAQNDEGFGIDEYPTEKDFRSDLHGGHCFSIIRKETGEMIAAFVLAVSRYYRGQNVVDPFIIVKKSERRHGIGEFCFKMCVDYARALGYIGMYVDTFSYNAAMIRIIEGAKGFDRVGCLPMGGRLKDGSILYGGECMKVTVVYPVGKESLSMGVESNRVISERVPNMQRSF